MDAQPPKPKLSHRQIIRNRIISGCLILLLVAAIIFNRPWLMMTAFGINFVVIIFVLLYGWRTTGNRTLLHMGLGAIALSLILMVGIYAEQYHQLHLAYYTEPVIVFASALVLVSRVFGRRKKPSGKV